MAEINEEAIQDYLDEQMGTGLEEEVQPIVTEQPQPEAFQNWDSYTSDPEYQTLGKDQKQQLYDSWRKYATDYLASTGNLLTREDIDYAQNYFNDVAETEGLRRPDYTPPGYAQQLIEQGQSGLRSFQSGIAGYGALIGAADPDEVANAIVSRNREEDQRYISPEFKEYSQKQLGFFGATKELISNPFDLVLPFFAQSFGSNLPALGLSLTAGAAGTAVGGPAVGAVTGLYTGAALGGATDAVVTVGQLINDEVRKRGLDPLKPEDVASVLKDPEFKERALKESTARGLAIGATGLASLGLGQILARPAAEIAKLGAGAVAREGARQLAIQTVAEPVGESAAQVGAQIATGQPIALRGREIAEETFVGLPTAAVEAGALTYSNLVQNNAPSTANEVLRESVTAFRQGELEKILGEPTTDQSVANFYDSLTIGEKARTLGLAPNAILTQGQGSYANLSDAEKAVVGQAFEGAKQATAPAVTAAEAEAKAAEEAQRALEAVIEAPAPVAEEPAPTVKALAPVAETPAETPAVTQVAEAPTPAPAPTPITEAPPIAEAPKAELGTVAPATAAVVKAEAPVPVAPTPAPAPVTPAPVVAPPTPAVKILAPTKKQISALEKLGYLPADITALNRTQAKDIIAKQTPKVEAPKEAPQVTAPAGVTEAPAVAPAPVVPPTPATPAQPTVGEAGGPVAPPAGGPATQETVEQRLAKADQKLTAVLEKLGGALDPDVKLDNATVTAYFGGIPDQQTQRKVQALLRLVTLGLSNSKQRLARAKGAGRNLGETFTNINKIVFTRDQTGGGGIYADPRNPFEAGTLYINPDQLTRALLTDLTRDPADFFASMLEEEIIHANHGKAMVRAFVQTFPAEQNPEIYTSPRATLDAFTKFYDAQNKEIENSLTLDQIKRVVGRYAQSLGIDMAGKTKEQIIQEFNAGRPGRLAEEYLRAFIQERQLGAITEDQVKAYATRPILRALGALRNWFRDLVGRGVGRESQKTFIDKQHDAILDLLLNSSQVELRAAQEETNTAIPGRILASSIDPFAQEIQRQNKQSKSEIQTEIERELGEGGLWRRTIIGRLKKAYPAVDPAEVESLVYASVPEALGSFDEGRGTKFSTHLTNIANRKILREKMKTVRRQAREFVSFQAPGFYNVPTELRNAETVENEVEAEREDLTLDQLAEKVVTRAPTLEAEIKAQEKVAPVVEERAIATAYDPETGKTNVAEEDQELEELTLADGEQISSLDAEVAEKRTAYIEAQLGEAGRLLAGAARALGLTKLETEILAYAADPDASPLNRKQITDKYGLTNDQFTNMRDDVLNRMREQLGRAGVTRTADVLATSIDPTQSQALARAKTTLPKDVAAEINAVVKDPFTDEQLEREARDFVKANSPNGDVMHAKRILDGRPNMRFEERVATLAVIGKILRDRAFKVETDIEKSGNSPERTALRQYLNTNLKEVFSAAQELATRAGQELRAIRTANGIFLPYNWERLYTGPISEQQEEALKYKQEVIQLKSELERLRDVLARDAGNGISIEVPAGAEATARIRVTPRPPEAPVPEGENFYQLLSLFGDLAPVEGENFADYLTRLGVPYDDVIAAIEGVKAASVSATGVSRIVPTNLRSLPASEAIRQLVNIDKNFFGKLVSLRLKSGGGATQAEVVAGLERKKTDTKARPLELQTVFDFFNSTESTKPTSETPIDKDPLPPLVRLAKYASDTITDRIMRSLGADKTKTPSDSFTKLERQVRTLVNAQFKQETNPTQVSPEDTRSVEQRLLDMVQRISLAETVFNQVKAGLQEEIATDNRARELKAEGQLTAKQRAELEERAAREFNPNAINTLDSLLRKVIDFKAEARKHMTQRGATIESLQSIITQKFPNFSETQAQALAKFLGARYAKLVEDARSKQLANIVRRIGEKETAMPKSKMQQIFELINLGAFDDATFYNAIAERYDLPEWDPAIAEEVRKRADKIQRLPKDSDQQLTESFLLNAFIANEHNKQRKGFEKVGRWLDVASSLWKAGVLSGPPTQLVNLGATHLNVLMELFAEANAYRKAAEAKGLDGKFNEFLATGLAAYFDSVGRVGAEQAGDAFATGLTRFRNEKQTELTPLENFTFDTTKPWKLSNYVAAWKIVGRAMAAADTYNSVIANEAKARMAARYSMLVDGMTAEEATKRTNEIFDRNNATNKAIEEQVGQEEAQGQFGSLAGLDPKSSAYRSEKRKIEAGKRRRYAQLREQTAAREANIQDLTEIRKFTETATFNNQPQGLIGYIGGHIVGSMVGRVPILVPFAAFPRTIANIINAGLNYTPYGFARANGFSIGNAFGVVRDKGYAFAGPEKDSVEYHKLQTQALYGSIAIFTLIGLALRDMDKDWDDAFFAVTGRGPADPEKREQLRSAGWVENSVKFGPLRFKHTDFPGLNTIFGAMALISDDWRYGKLSERDAGTILTTAALGIGNSIFDKQLLSGAKTLFEAVSDRGDASTKAKRVIQSYAGGFLNPGFARWMTRTFNIGADGMVGVTDTKELNSTVGGFLLGLTPAAVIAGKPALNRLGEPIREYPYTATMRRFGFVPEVKEHPVFTPLVRAGLFVPGASINLKINDFEGGKPIQRKMDQAEFYNYSKYNGEYLRRRLTPQKAEALARLATRNQDAAQKQLEDLTRASKDYAKARIEAEIRLNRRRK